MALISELPLMDTILAAEKKHGIDIHMVIEAVPRKNSSPENVEEATEDDVIWYVEFQDIKKTFDKFSQVRTFLLEEAVARNDELVIKLNGK